MVQGDGDDIFRWNFKMHRFRRVEKFVLFQRLNLEFCVSVWLFFLGFLVRDFGTFHVL